MGQEKKIGQKKNCPSPHQISNGPSLTFLKFLDFFFFSVSFKNLLIFRRFWAIFRKYPYLLSFHICPWSPDDFEVQGILDAISLCCPYVRYWRFEWIQLQV